MKCVSAALVHLLVFSHSNEGAFGLSTTAAKSVLLRPGGRTIGRPQLHRQGVSSTTLSSSTTFEVDAEGSANVSPFPVQDAKGGAGGPIPLSELSASASNFTQQLDSQIPSSFGDDLKSEQTEEQLVATASKREMLSFAIPALGIFLTNPLLSNIDNAFVGKTSGTSGLAALSPATICTDQILYLFSFLSRATTGLVSRAYMGDDVDAAREAAAAPLTVSIFCGLALSVLYAVGTPALLGAMNVNPALRPDAAGYIYWRGAVAAAALAQASALQVLLATRDAVTPLAIVATAAVVNVLGDGLFCMWPFRWGCAGAAAATSLATLVSSGFMLKALNTKRLLPSLRMPNRKEMQSLMEFTGPLLAITITRLIGFVAMQRTAMSLGVLPLAGYQLCINVVMFFLLFGEPLSQLSQTKLPALVDSEDGDAIMANLKSVLTLGAGASVGVGALAYATVRFGAGIFSSDPAVQLMAQSAAPAVFMAVSQAIMAITVDGAMVASRDFGFMLLLGTLACLMQLNTLKWCTSLSAIFSTFTFRLGSYAAAVVARVALGHGALGRVIHKSWKKKTAVPEMAQ